VLIARGAGICIEEVYLHWQRVRAAARALGHCRARRGGSREAMNYSAAQLGIAPRVTGRHAHISSCYLLDSQAVDLEAIYEMQGRSFAFEI
jgi:hypothetical protein